MSHALISPSSLERTIACPPSVRLGQYEQDTSGVAAEEGTCAHALGETALHKYNGDISEKEFRSRLKIIREDKDSSGRVMYNDTMQDFTDGYTDSVIGAVGRKSVLFVEKKVYFTDYVQEGSGTSDAAIVTGDFLDMWDYKYGKGLVSAVDNPQLKAYALGFLNLLRMYNEFKGTNYNIKRIRLNIYQPRISNHSVFELTVEELYDWAENVLKPAAALAWEGKGELKAGNHCKYCKVAGNCKKLTEYSLELMKEEFSNHALLTDSQMIEMYKRLDIARSWADSVESYMLRQALAGKKWEGLKVVESKANRVYTDPEKIEKECLKRGFEEIYTPKQLLGITALTKALSKKVFDDITGPYIKKPRGSPQLAPVHDPREPFNSAKQDFKAVNQKLDILN